ncbi:MAG: aminopeptidase P family protein [Bacteroidales bacterium]|nr:aminopeptidase P family protein [Bacteroidales bacterium]
MTKASIITQRVEALRQWMREHQLMAFIFPSTDPHAGEYVPDRWKCREWISGFNGSAGIAVVTLKRAALWTDSRYWLAAEEQLEGTPFELIRCKRNVATAAELAEWIQAENNMQHPVGIDGWCYMQSEAAALEAELMARGMMLRTESDPAAALWKERPAIPLNPVEVQPLEYAGETVESKLARLREALKGLHANALIVTQLDQIAWTLNLRGTDVHCTPLFVSYLAILPDEVILYVAPEKLTWEVKDYLRANHIHTRRYEELAEDLGNGRSLRGLTFLVDTAVTNATIYNHISLIEPLPGESVMPDDFIAFAGGLTHKTELPVGASIVEAESPIAQMMTMKNDAEIAGFRRAMLKDGVALVKFLRWLKPAVEAGGVTEIGVDRKLTGLRAEQEGFRDISFDTIAGYGAHAAIVHYEASPETDVPLEPHGLLLLDSGAQYLDGTTDITRTIALGPLTDSERRDYTLVLKGHIRLAMAVFPEGTSGTQLDVLARYAMWQEHKNFGHGTGHGVGSYLSVHEGPHQFRMNWMPAPLRAGMTITDEPGIYIAGSHGARTENTMLIVEDGEPGWLRLEPLTLCPIDTTPIVRELMANDEINYLNRYHDHVREALLPLLDDEADREWLRAATQKF